MIYELCAYAPLESEEDRAMAGADLAQFGKNPAVYLSDETAAKIIKAVSGVELSSGDVVAPIWPASYVQFARQPFGNLPANKLQAVKALLANDENGAEATALLDAIIKAGKCVDLLAEGSYEKGRTGRYHLSVDHNSQAYRATFLPDFFLPLLKEAIAPGFEEAFSKENGAVDLTKLSDCIGKMKAAPNAKDFSALIARLEPFLDTIKEWGAERAWFSLRTRTATMPPRFAQDDFTMAKAHLASLFAAVPAEQEKPCIYTALASLNLDYDISEGRDATEISWTNNEEIPSSAVDLAHVVAALRNANFSIEDTWTRERKLAQICHVFVAA